MTDASNYSLLLDEIAAELDIPPSKYAQAVQRYTSVGEWLCGDDNSDCMDDPDVYPQGSFRLGTIVRPLKDGKESDYDIDLVFEIKKEKDATTSKEIKERVGTRLNNHGTYRKLLKPEGRRCWTLEYSETDDVGFHLDILPAIPKTPSTGAIHITHRSGDGTYEWSASNPKGYAQWFEAKNITAFITLEKTQKTMLFESNRELFSSIDDVPNQLIKTPLQRTIQILKRHRDQRFANHPSHSSKPISMIITTLAAQLYSNETTTFEALKNIVFKLDAHANLQQHDFILEKSLADQKLILRTPDDKWIIPNPVAPEENFADRWHENNHERAKMFFQWVKWVREDLVDILAKRSIAQLTESIEPFFGERAVKMASSRLPFLAASGIITQIPTNTPRIEITNPPKPWSN